MLAFTAGGLIYIATSDHVPLLRSDQCSASIPTQFTSTMVGVISMQAILWWESITLFWPAKVINLCCRTVIFNKERTQQDSFVIPRIETYEEPQWIQVQKKSTQSILIESVRCMSALLVGRPVFQKNQLKIELQKVSDTNQLLLQTSFFFLLESYARAIAAAVATISRI